MTDWRGVTEVRGTCPHCGGTKGKKIQVKSGGVTVKTYVECLNKRCGLYW